MTWLDDRPKVGDRVRVTDVARENAESGMSGYPTFPHGAGTVTRVWTTEELFAARFGNKRPARVTVSWDEPGDARPDATWRVGDLEPAAR